MKYFAFYVLICFIACSSNSSIKEKQLADNLQKENKSQETTTPTSINPEDEDIIGEWKLSMTILDKNRNNKIDEEEKANPMAPLNDYLKLNSDGSAVFSQVKAKGRYEIKSNSDGTSKYLNLYDKDNFKTPYGRIISVTKSELILFKNSIGPVFFIWKKS